MLFIMTLHTPCGGLHLLAQIAVDDYECSKSTSYFQDPRRLQHMYSPVLHNVLIKNPETCTDKRLFDELISSGSASGSSSSYSSSRVTRGSARSSKKKTRSSTSSRPGLETKLELRKKRETLLDRAMKIKSLDNSPVNERQLLVLRMVYDEITVYPSEAWMVILAIIIHRAHKQVKNWFSNERQKRGSGEVISVVTETGDKLRIRPLAYQLKPDWSDDFFEEVVMIHNFRVLCHSRMQAGRALSDTSSNLDGHS